MVLLRNCPQKGENMKEETNTTKPARAKDLASLLRNPLVIFGLVLLAGDGPLVIVYGLTSDPVRAWVSLIAILLLTIGMAGFFCYLVACKPRHLYAPEEIPETALGKSLYRDEIVTTTVARAGIAKPEPLSSDALRAVINNLQEGLCWFLLKVANKDIEVDEFIETLIEETNLDIYNKTWNYKTYISIGYSAGLGNLLGLLFKMSASTEENKVTFEVSPEVLNLIVQRLRPELANSS